MPTSNLLQRATRIGAVTLIWSCVQMSGQAAPRPHYHITSLGTLPGGDEVFPFSLNNHGDVVGRAMNSNHVFRPFVFRDGNMTELPVGDAGHVFYINDRGDIVAQAIIDRFYYRAFFITPEGIIDLDAQTGLEIWPAGINNSGVIAGTASRGVISDAITWSNGVVRYFGYPQAAYGTFARDINNRGDVLIGFGLEAPPGPGAFTAIVQDGVPTLLGDFYGESLNDRGHIAGTDRLGGVQGFLYRPDGSLLLGVLPGDYYSRALKINNADQVIGYSEDGDDHIRPFLYSDGAMYDLNDLIRPHSGWILLSAADINDRGQIVGFGLYRGERRGFLLTPTGKPGSSRSNR